MLKRVFLAVIVIGLGLVSGVETYGQDAAALAAALDKSKHKKKEKVVRGVDYSFEFYMDVKNQPVLKDAAAYSGTYSAEEGGYVLQLRVNADGTAEGNGYDTLYTQGESRVAFSLSNGRMNGAVLTANKVFADGRTTRFEAVFVNRTVLTGKNAGQIDTRETKFGLGFMQSHDSWTNRVFLAAK